jgi:hypothetical protein
VDGLEGGDGGFCKDMLLLFSWTFFEDLKKLKLDVDFIDCSSTQIEGGVGAVRWSFLSGRGIGVQSSSGVDSRRSRSFYIHIVEVNGCRGIQRWTCVGAALDCCVCIFVLWWRRRLVNLELLILMFVS